MKKLNQYKKRTLSLALLLLVGAAVGGFFYNKRNIRNFVMMYL